MKNTLKRLRSFTYSFCITLVTDFVLREVIAQTPNENNSLILSQEINDQRLNTKVLSNRLGQSDDIKRNDGVLLEAESGSRYSTSC